MNGHPWTPEERFELLDLAERGATQAEAARRLGRSFSSVKSYVRSRGLAWRARLTSLERIARDLACSPSTVARVARALGVPYRRRGNGRRYLLDPIEEGRVRGVLERQLRRREVYRAAGRRRGRC